MMKFYGSVLLVSIVLMSACSHSKPKADENPPPLTKQDSETREVMSMPDCGPKGCGSSANDYLNTVALPKILNSSVVQKCFLSNPKTKKKELKPGFLSYRFEITLAALQNQVVVDNVYLSSFQNVPEWTKPCLIDGYRKFTFPPFPDKNMKSTSAFGTVSTSWNPNQE